jgi:hypothetical protein
MTELKEKRFLRVGSGNIVSQLFFFWLFPFIFAIRRTKDIKDLHLILRKTETSSYNDELLEKSWRAEKENAAKNNK